MIATAIAGRGDVDERRIASTGQQRRRCWDQFGKFSEVLSGGSEVEFVTSTVRAAQSEPVELQNAFCGRPDSGGRLAPAQRRGQRRARPAGREMHRLDGGDRRHADAPLPRRRPKAPLVFQICRNSLQAATAADRAEPEQGGAEERKGGGLRHCSNGRRSRHFDPQPRGTSIVINDEIERVRATDEATR